MLTADLVRYRIADDRVMPRYITRKRSAVYLAFCKQLLDVYDNHRGKTQGQIQEALEILEGKRTDFKILRGLNKLLSENAEFCPSRQMDFPSFRRHIFLQAQDRYPIVSKSDLLHKNERRSVLAETARVYKVPVKEIDSLLYGDLPENQILTSFETSYTPETLLKRYNLALAQGLLYWAIRMRILIQQDFRIVFQHIKLSNLMYRIRYLPSGIMEIELDGPASIIRNTQRYGIRMANFLPGLLLADRWEMRADIQTHQGPKYFYLDAGCGLTSHYTPRDPFDSQIEANFYHKFSRIERDWRIEREGEVIDLGDSIFIPDFSFQHEDGRRAHLEIIGFWTQDYLAKKLEKIRRSRSKNLILAVNKLLNCSRDDFTGEVIFYRTGIKIGELIDRLEKVAC